MMGSVDLKTDHVIWPCGIQVQLLIREVLPVERFKSCKVVHGALEIELKYEMRASASDMILVG